MFIRMNDIVINTDMIEVIEKKETGILFSFSGNEILIPTQCAEETIKKLMRTMNTGFASAIFREV